MSEGGLSGAKSELLSVLKGKAPEGEFMVGGYNNLDWSLKGIIRESMIKGQQVVLFLHPTAVFRGTEPVIKIQ